MFVLFFFNLKIGENGENDSVQGNDEWKEERKGENKWYEKIIVTKKERMEE